MKRILSGVLAAVLALSLAACGAAQSEEAVSSAPEASSAPAVSSAADSGEELEAQQARIGGLKGPTTMGMLKLMQDVQTQADPDQWQVEMYGAPAEVLPLITKGELDMATVPVNMAATLYNRTQGQVQVAAVNTLGVLYIVSTDDSVKTVADLAGRTIYSSGKSTTPEYVLRYLLEKNGLDPDKDVTLEFKSESTEVLAALKTASEPAVALLPQPFVTAAQMQVEGLQVALDLTQEWNKVNPDSQMITGVLVVRKDFAQEHPEAVDAFLKDYQASIQYVNEHTEEAAQWAMDAGVVAKAEIAKKALPACNIAYEAGEKMKQDVSGYLAVMAEQDPESVGGAVPADDFYYGV